MFDSHIACRRENRFWKVSIGHVEFEVLTIFKWTLNRDAVGNLGLFIGILWLELCFGGYQHTVGMTHQWAGSPQAGCTDSEE